MEKEKKELWDISSRLCNLCDVMSFIARTVDMPYYGNIMSHMADSLTRISDDFVGILEDN